LTSHPKPITIYVDADACPVKQEVYRVAGRHRVEQQPDRGAARAADRAGVVAAGMDAADHYIAGRADRGDVVITADIPLASRCVKAGADAIAPTGKPFTEESIGLALATRNLMDALRSAGEITGGPKTFSPRDRSSFLSALDRAIVRLKRAGFGESG
jgi:uncharacterized protein YaiI (UPF0178 family)